MLATALAVPLWFELLATIVYAISGSLSAVRARYDIFGTVCMAIVVGLLGGVLRDILLQDYGIYAFQNPTLILACALTGVVVFYFSKLTKYFGSLFDFIDALGMALWTIISVSKGLSAGLEIIPAVIMGTITAIGGGIARDVLMNQPVAAFRSGTLYGSAALIGAIVYAIMRQYHVLDAWAAICCVGIVLGVRYLSVAMDWHTAPPRDFTDDVVNVIAKPAKAIAKKTRPTREIRGLTMTKPVLRLDKTGQIGRPLEVRTKPEPKSTKHRDRLEGE